jgi:hypothetical protein
MWNLFSRLEQGQGLSQRPPRNSPHMGPPVHSPPQLGPGWGSEIDGFMHPLLWFCLTHQEARWLPDFLVLQINPKAGVGTAQGRTIWPESTTRLCVGLAEIQLTSIPVYQWNHYANKEPCQGPTSVCMELLSSYVLLSDWRRGGAVCWGTRNPHSLGPVLDLAQALSVVVSAR